MKHLLKKLNVILVLLSVEKSGTEIVKPQFHQNKLIRKKETEQAHLCLGL